LARVIPECWISDRGTQRGDVALLELDRFVTCHQGARLRQAPVRNVAVRVCGFPDGGRIGIIADARLVGASYDGEWVEMHAVSGDRGQWVTHGYSGAGVASEASGDVVGIVVAVREAGSSVNAWMMPVETIVGYLPSVAGYVDGGGTADPTFDRHSGDPARAAVPGTPPETAAGLALRKEVGRLFAGVWSGTAVITGGTLDAGTPWLARLVATADPSARRRMSDEAIAVIPHDAVLGIGAIDLAVDAGGRTVREVRHRIAERFGLPDDDSSGLAGRLLHRQPPPAMVIDRVDGAAEPSRLIGELIAPLAAQARRRGVRLVLGFAGPPPADLPCEISLGPEPVTGTPHGSAGPRAVRRLLTELADAEEELVMLYADVSTRVAGVPRPPPCLAPWLRVRYAVSAGEGPASELALIRDRAEAAASDARRRSDRLRKLKGEHDDLRTTLDVYRELAERRFGAEDPQLGPYYATAHDALSSGPRDLRASRAAVDQYVDAVRRRISAGREKEARDFL
jgi:hypothetical protein